MSTAPRFPVGLVTFTELVERVNTACAERHLKPPAFRSPPTDRDKRRTIQRFDGQAIVSVRIVMRELPDVARDMVEGLGVVLELDSATVEAILGDVLNRPRDWELPAVDPDEVAF